MAETTSVYRSEVDVSVTTIESPAIQSPEIRMFGLSFFGDGLEAAALGVTQRAASGLGGYGCLVNAHMIAERGQNKQLSAAMEQAQWLFPDGKPVAMLSRWRGASRNVHIPGEALCLAVLEQAAQNGVPIYLYGGSQAVLDILIEQLPQQFPGLIIAGHHSPPFRPLNETEQELIAENIQESGAKICLVALGCPKQEIWMHQHADKLNCAMLGVGAAFPMMAGTMPRAPKWMSRLGLEWFYRLCQEPKRLLRRYVVGNAIFLMLAVKDLRAPSHFRNATRR